MQLIAYEEILHNKIQKADEFKECSRIKTRCIHLDEILHGGVPVNGIVEIFGCSGAGKTQFCLHLCLQIQLPVELGGFGKEVVYICTEDVFPSKRLHQLAQAFRKKYKTNINFEDHIYIQHIATSVQLRNVIKHHLPHFIKFKNVGLIVIDSIAGCFRSETETLDYIFRSNMLNSIANNLNSLQDQFDCAVLTVNQVSDTATGATEPCLGLAWANNITSRYSLSRKNEFGTRVFEVVFAPDLPPKSCDILITPEGLMDI
ncbi:DNA repair protein XRCC3-like isoform X2 [Anthonomus grandis grandis]|nr:DNA repair protein XRCC3-like isoform X2 [Anthonomus grandis grandis]